MTDLSSTLDSLLQHHNVRLAQHRRSLDDIRDEFLKEAYKIHSHVSELYSELRRIRGPYLSASQPTRNRRQGTGSSQKGAQTHYTNAQRDAIDAESKATLRDLNASILKLVSVEQARKDIHGRVVAKKRVRPGLGGALGRWAAGGGTITTTRTPEEELEDAEQQTLDAWRESVIWYLRKKLGEAAELQQDMMERRVQREIEKSKSVLYKTKGLDGFEGEETDHVNGNIRNGSSVARARGASSASRAAALGLEGTSGHPESSLSGEQIQMFEEENSAMLKHYEDTLDQVRAAERSMIEISELQTTLAQNLEMQTTRIEQLVEDSTNTEQNVLGGNKQLKQAAEAWRPARTVFWITCGLGAFLVGWDLII